MPRQAYDENCVFCKIIADKIPAKKIYNDDHVAAFGDLNPVAPVHILIVPKIHIETLNDLLPEDALLMGKLTLVAKDVAKQTGVAESGYRFGFNCGRDAGQTVFHIHGHLIGGAAMGWPPFPKG
jgi:histidine triad (HIT) family protein